MSKNKRTKTIDKRLLPKHKRGRPTTGQSGPPIDLAIDDMNKTESRLVAALAIPGRPVMTSPDLMRAAGVKTRVQLANALRRPVRGGWVENVGAVEVGDVLSKRGNYKLTKLAADRLRRAGGVSQ